MRKLDDGLCALNEGTFDTVLVDLCGEEGLLAALSLKGHLREIGSLASVLMISAGGHLEELSALEAGVDDWIAKPSTPAVVEARLRIRLLRRSEMRSLSAGAFEIDLDSHVGKLGGREICFTETETKVLEVLLEHPGRIVSKMALIERVYGLGYPGTDHGLQSAVKRIRLKIEANPKEPVCLLNVHGQGYRFDPPKIVMSISEAPKRTRSDERPAPELVASR
ncbi:response regulator transcription factor [Granulicella sp. L60]|uniref:response regulator transcription factor n=1 Tax=Granulicella sp. L60 TaxID=1641866 RepID=UPI00131D92E4|nr:response regulator transcription factor [Granulicella sp. L60]